MKINIKASGCCLFLALFLHAGASSASPITLSPIDSGYFHNQWDSYWDENERFHVKGLSALSPSYYGEGGREQIGYVIYDLADIFGEVSDAYLSLDLTMSGLIAPTHAITLITSTDLLPADQLLLLPEGDITPAQWNALQAFPVLGQQETPSALGQGIYDVTLNQFGLDLVANKGLLVLTIVWNRLEDLAADGGVVFNRAPELVLSVRQGPEIPLPESEVSLPGTLSLFVLSSLALAVVHRRRPAI